MQSLSFVLFSSRGGVSRLFKFNFKLKDALSLPSTNALRRAFPSPNRRPCTTHNRSSGNRNSISVTSKPTQKMDTISERRWQHQAQGQERQICSSSSADSNPKVNKLQGLLHSDPSRGWEKCWVEEVTPWDLGQPTPVMVHLHKAGALPKGRVLIPGCGSGHDVVAIACSERFVVGLDISDRAIEKAIELSSSSPNADHFTFLKRDFFSWHPTELFDLIFDYTFFCAIKPEMRSCWARQMQDLLKPDGELITLIFPIEDHVGGPPYAVSVADYEEVLHPMGFKAVSVVENELAIGPRKGREKLGRWKRVFNRSSL